MKNTGDCEWKTTLFPVNQVTANLNDACSESRQSINLLECIKVPSANVGFVMGPNGFAAFEIGREADIKSPYRLYGSASLFHDFSIKTRLKLDDVVDAGYVFAVTNPSDTVIQLGLQIESLGPIYKISLLYADAGKDRDILSNKLATFSIPNLVGRWTDLDLRVQGDNITFYYNCKEYGMMALRREPVPLIFDPASTLHLFNDGSSRTRTSNP
ncbi:Uncharacterised protein g1308 [Pycnogonum litorale]